MTNVEDRWTLPTAIERISLTKFLAVNEKLQLKYRQKIYPNGNKSFIDFFMCYDNT